MANPTPSSDLGTLAREIFRATPAYIFFSALKSVLKERSAEAGRRAVAPAR
jgi:hypothetical protein